MYAIRTATPKDIGDIIGIIKLLDIDRGYPVTESDINTDLFYVAEDEGRVIGISGYEFFGTKGAITTFLGVLPEYKGKGIGYALQKQRMEAVKSLRCDRLLTATPTRESAEWYKRYFGYVEIASSRKIINLELKLGSLPCRNSDLVKPLIINCCLTGGVHSKSDNPYLPVTPEEIIRDAIEVWNLGASIVHVHARDSEGNPTFDPEVYKRIVYGIRENTDLIVNVSTSARSGNSKEQRAAGLLLDRDYRPDMASLTVGSHNFLNQANVNPPEAITYLAKTMIEQGVKPELEVFEIGMLDYACHLVKKRMIKMPLYVNTLFNSPGTLLATRGNIQAVGNSLPLHTIWSMAGIGREQINIMRWAIENGNHVRIGLEDNLWMDDSKTIHASNPKLVSATAEWANKNGRPLATPREARSIIGI